MTDTVLITGVSRGLGYELARALLEKGCRVVGGARNPESQGAKELTARFGERFSVLKMDVTDTESVAAAAQLVAGVRESIDICINNAGLYTRQGLTLEDLDFDGALEMYDVNALGALRVAGYFSALLVKGRRPLLLNISSEAGSICDNDRDAEFGYCMSKAALNQATLFLARKFRTAPLKVFAIHPGWMRTDMGGPEASEDPVRSAEAIICLLDMCREKADCPVFMDWQGKQLAW